MEKKKYYLGLDIGTDSVGWATADPRYNIPKFKGDALWGSHLFDAANQAADRRGFRTARRRLDRRQQRVHLIDEIFAPEVSKIDKDFYRRIKESALYGDDKSVEGDYLYFNDKSFTDADYHKKYPTIHHLLTDLINDTETCFDIRLINIAVDWFVAHRGHFLYDVDVKNVEKILDIKPLYEDFMNYFDNEGIDKPWDAVNPDDFGAVLKKRGINNKKLAFKELLKIYVYDDYFIDTNNLITFISGGKIQLKKLFNDSAFEDNDESISLSDDPDEMLPKLGEYADFISLIVAMHDWSMLSDLLAGHKCISEAKVITYERHKKDLSDLKRFVRKYRPEKYYEIFRKSAPDLKNYTAYSYNLKSVNKEEEYPKGKAKKEDFCKYLKSTLKLDSIEVDEADTAFLEDLKARLDDCTFLPKQVNSDNRVIPYQLYYDELKKILKNAVKHYPFLNDSSDGVSNSEKIQSVFEFRIPYYVGPLGTYNKKNAWMVRKAGTEGRILPWNFNEKVDLNMSEKAFIDRMTNNCTYLPGKEVLPKYSLLYGKFTVLNEINNIKSNGVYISVEAKQAIYNGLFCKNAKVTVKRIKELLVAEGYVKENDLLSGLDISVKSSLKSYNDFKRLINGGILSTEDVENIIRMRTYTEDNRRFKNWLKSEYAQLSEGDYKHVCGLKYKDFGRLSGEFLNGLEGTNKSTGEMGTIMHFLWESNDNLMQLLSDEYTFTEEIEKYCREYYAVNNLTLAEQLDEMGLSNAVKRPVIRTLDIVKEVTKAMKAAPEKIFVEMARGPEEKKKRTVTRYDRIMELYKNAKEDTVELRKQLEAMGDTANNKLQSEALFLYYMQLGKCMYSGEPINLAELKTTKYNIDHIYPQSYVKDDSIDNKVLVLSEINGAKTDIYPISASIREKMHARWKMLNRIGLVSDEKLNRLTRSTPFSEEEKYGFINRQLVETRQSMKAVTQILKNIYPESEIVYVKASLAADFKKEFELPPKSRIINDLHHAKDAYLNIVVGNVYHEKFTKRFFNINEERYSLKTKKLFAYELVRNGEVIWNPDIDFATVRKMYSKNNIHLTRYAYCQKGGLFDQMPVKKGNGQIELKQGRSKDQYGGYNKATASFFVIARYMRGKKREVTFVPIDLMVKDKFLADDSFCFEYVKNVLQGMNSKLISCIEFPLGKRLIKIKTVLSLDGYRVWINGKEGGGRKVVFSSAESAIYDKETVEYIKRIENYVEKKKINKNCLHDELYDGLSFGKNLEIYDIIVDKLKSERFCKMPGNQGEVLSEGRDIFISLPFDEQIRLLMNSIGLLKSGRAGGCDLSLLQQSSQSGKMYIGVNL